MITISKIEPPDFERLFAIEQSAHLMPWSMGILKNNQGERYINLKISQHQHIVGFAICHIVLDEATLFNIAIDPDYQAQGFGKQLLNALIEQLKHRHISTLWLEVRESNPARQLYQQMGFNEVDIRKHYYPTPQGTRENAIVMALYL